MTQPALLVADASAVQYGPPVKTLRHYQKEAISSIVEDWALGIRALISLPTGTGKTFTIAELFKMVMQAGSRSIFVVHEEGLLHQSYGQFQETLGPLGFTIGRVKSNQFPEAEMQADVVVAMVQSMTDSRIEALGAFDYMAVDEVHHYVDNTFMAKILEIEKKNPETRMVGCTATHFRTDNKSLGMLFEGVAQRNELTYVYTIAQAIRDQYLAPFTAMLVEAELDISQFKAHMGYIGTEEQWNKLWEAGNWAELLYDEMVRAGFPDKLTMAFMPSVDISYKMAQWLSEEHGYITGHGDGEASYIFNDGKATKVERKELYAKFRKKEVIFFSNYAIAVEGFDAPLIEILVMNRPTNSRVLYAQMLGRSLRKTDDLPNKKAAILHVNFEDHQMRLVDFKGLAGVIPTKEAKEVEEKIEALTAGREAEYEVLCMSCGQGKLRRQFGTENYVCDYCQAIVCEPGKFTGGEPLFDPSKLNGVGTAVRVIDLLHQNVVKWYMEDGISSAGIGVGSDRDHPEAERTILVVPAGKIPAYPDKWCVVQVLRPVLNKDWIRSNRWGGYWKYSYGPKEGVITPLDDKSEAMEYAIALAENLRDPNLADKGKDWLKNKASDAQKGLLAKLNVPFSPGLDKGTAAKLISHHLAVQYMRQKGLMD